MGSLIKGDDLYNPYVALKYRTHETIPSEFAMSSYGNELMPNESKWEAYDQHLFKLANSIETYGNIFPMKKAEKIQNMILHAKNTYIFGFSFAKQNMDILFKEIPSELKAPFASGKVDGSCYLVPTEMLGELRHFARKYFHGIPVFLQDDRNKTTVADFFTNYSIKI